MHGDRAYQRHRNAAVQLYFNDDQYQCIVLEWYKDSEALIQHAANVGGLEEPARAWQPGRAALWRYSEYM